MKNSAQFSLAVHTMLMVAYFPKLHITSSMVAVSAGCHPVIIRNAFSKLREAGLLITKSGKGKTELARPADEITLLDIYKAVEGDDAGSIFKIHSSPLGLCPIGGNIQSLLGSHLTDAANAMQRELSRITLQGLIDELKAQQRGILPAPESEHKKEGL